MSTYVFIQSIKSLSTCTLLCLAYRTYKQDCTAAIKVKLSGDKKALRLLKWIWITTMRLIAMLS